MDVCTIIECDTNKTNSNLLQSIDTEPSYRNERMSIVCPIEMSNFTYSSTLIAFCTEIRALVKQVKEKGEDGQRIFPSFSSHGISASPGKTPFSCKIY